MAAILGNLLRSAGTGLGNAAARAAGATAGGVIADEAAREVAQKRAEAADKAKETPIAKSEAGTQGKTRRKCDKCAAECGQEHLHRFSKWSENTIEYQLRIGGMRLAPGGIIEWIYNGVQFDGFDASQCLLKEAKANYDQFFNEFGQVHAWWRPSESAMIGELSRQSAAASPRPPIRLHWFFQTSMAYRHFSRIFKAAYPDVEVHFEP